MEDVRKIIETSDDKFRYQFLGRLKSDCDYFLDYLYYDDRYVNRYCLWDNSIDKHIELMRFVYSFFNDETKPEWLSENDIDEYEKKMKE